jgi:hypothetical protein
MIITVVLDKRLVVSVVASYVYYFVTKKNVKTIP